MCAIIPPLVSSALCVPSTEEGSGGTGMQKQETIRATEIKPYVERVQKIVERDRTGKIHAGLEKVVGIMRDHADGTVSDS